MTAARKELTNPSKYSGSKGFSDHFSSVRSRLFEKLEGKSFVVVEKEKVMLKPVERKSKIRVG